MMIVRNISLLEIETDALLKQIDDAEIINSNRTANAASPALEISSGS
jgi:hypothetical protein